jgi:hypothetical protein
MSESDTTEDQVRMVEEIVDQIRPFLAGVEPQIIAGVLADLTATLLAAHVLHDDAGIIDRDETDKMRNALLHEHIKAVCALIPVNEAELAERMQ